MGLCSLFSAVSSVPQGPVPFWFLMTQLAKFLSPHLLPYCLQESSCIVTITSRNVFLTFSSFTTLEDSSRRANSGLQYFFVFMSTHTSDEVPDNYVKYLGWIPGWKSSRDKQINHILKEGRGSTCTLTGYTRRPWVLSYSERNGWGREKAMKMTGQSRNFCFLLIPFPSPIFLPPAQSATDIPVINADLYTNKLEAYVYSCTLYFGIKFLNVVPTSCV